MLPILKALLPDRPVPMRVWRGPFRGAYIIANPRSSLRKVFGLYEYELNGWLERALGRVTRLLDVGANDGYFSLGCASAFRRRGVRGEVVCFEPQAHHAAQLRASLAGWDQGQVRFELVEASVGADIGPGMTTLDATSVADRACTLIKIDVEGAELDVIAGAASWMNPSNLFLIEVHKQRYLEQLVRQFSRHGLKVLQVNQRPLPLLGRGMREPDNWWLVSDLGEGGS